MELTDNYIINNFALCYEILSEVCEFGFPINLDLNYLKKYIDDINVDDSIFKISPLKRRSTINPLLGKVVPLEPLILPVIIAAIARSENHRQRKTLHGDHQELSIDATKFSLMSLNGLTC